MIWKSKCKIADTNTATDIHVSFKVSALEAASTVDLVFLPVSRRYLESRYFVMMLATRTMMVGIEYSTSPGVTISLMPITTICKPVMMMIRAIIIVTIRSILSRWLTHFLNFASFSLIMIKNPETESMRLWIASEAMAMELDTMPTTKLKIDSKKLTKIKV